MLYREKSYLAHLELSLGFTGQVVGMPYLAFKLIPLRWKRK
jgi:hypothetical protein